MTDAAQTLEEIAEGIAEVKEMVYIYILMQRLNVL